MDWMGNVTGLLSRARHNLDTRPNPDTCLNQEGVLY